MRTDVLVVGGGPAGCSAALTLARAGHQVVLVDKATFPRDKCCGDGLTTSALRQLEALGLDPKNVPSWRTVRKTAWRSPSGVVAEMELPAEDGMRIAVARRHDLDNALLQLVKSAGVTVLEGHTFQSMDATGRDLRAFVSENVISARYLIAADGAWSPVRKSLSTTPGKPYLGDIHAFRQYFTNVTGPARDRLFVSFEKDLLPGYLWSFPVGDNCVNIGFGIERHNGVSVQQMKHQWPDILGRPHIRAELGDTAVAQELHKAWPIPARISTSLLSGAEGRVLFVGDAARVVDPLTGEGIGQALETGRLAAECIHEFGDAQPARAAARYQRVVRTGMAIDNSVARSIAKLVRHEIAARAVLRAAPALDRLDHYALRWVFEDNPRAAALTPWRWRERFTPKGPAYTTLSEQAS